MTDPKARLESIRRRLSKVNADLQNLRGQYESASKAVAEIESECREKNIDPDRIDEIIEKLNEKFEHEASELEGMITKAEKDLAPYLGGS